MLPPTTAATRKAVLPRDTADLPDLHLFPKRHIHTPGTPALSTIPLSTVLARAPAAAARVSLRAGGGEGSGLRLPGHLMVPITRRPRRVMSGGQARRNNTHLVSDNVVRGPPLWTAVKAGNNLGNVNYFSLDIDVVFSLLMFGNYQGGEVDTAEEKKTIGSSKGKERKGIKNTLEAQ